MENKDLLQKLREAFRLETDERLRSMGNELLKLEQSPNEYGQSPILEVLFRDAHSLKGAARSVSLHTIEYFFQSVEEVFEQMKSNKISFNTELGDIFQKGFDLVADYTDDIDNIDKADDIDDMRDKIDNYLESLSGQASLPPLNSTIKVAEVPTAVVNKPKPIAPKKVEQQDKDTSKTSETTKITENAGIKTGSSVRISSEKLDSLMFSIEESTSVKSIFKEHINSLNTLNEDIQSAIKLSKTLSDKLNYFLTVVKRLKGYNLNKEDLDERCSRLDDLCSEVDQRIKYLEYQVSNHAKTATTNNYDIELLINENLENVREIALQPFSSLVSVYPRMMRDVARETGKEFGFTIEGADIEIDRRILEELNYPLIHLLRNAADHGIETPYKRKQLKKEQKAEVKLSASLSTGKKVEIIVSDDGSGIDVEKTRRKIIEKLKIPASQVEEMSDEEIMAYIFKSGFSTNQIITSLSGRGLGMSIVRDTVENIGGTIRIENKPGQSCSFIIEIPISMSSFKGVIVETGSQLYAIPMAFIKHVCIINPSEITSVNGHSAWLYNGKTIPVVSLDSVLKSNNNQIEDKPLCGLILSNSGMEAVITTDRIVSQMEMTVKTLGSVLKKVKNVSGVAAIGSNKIVPVLNTRDIIKSILQGKNAMTFSTKLQERKRNVLVVEDSITTRMLIVNILEAADFAVNAAVDGRQGYEMLTSGKYDLVVSDIEMPRMSGFELTAKIRKNKNLQDIPVILCTTLSKREDMERGIETGANAYITKGNFDQNNLLETVNRLI